MEEIRFWNDTETTGLDCNKNFIIQLAYIITKGDTVLVERNFKMRVDFVDGFEIDEGALKVNRTTMEELRGFPPESEVIKTIKKDLESMGGKATFAGYNCPFDAKFINALMTRQSMNFRDYFNAVYDVYQKVKKADVELKFNFANRKQSTVAEYFNITGDFHDALVDIRTCMEIDKRLKERYVEAGVKYE